MTPLPVVAVVPHSHLDITLHVESPTLAALICNEFLIKKVDDAAWRFSSARMGTESHAPETRQPDLQG